MLSIIFNAEAINIAGIIDIDINAVIAEIGISCRPIAYSCRQPGAKNIASRWPETLPRGSFPE